MLSWQWHACIIWSLKTYIKNQYAYIAARPIHDVSIYKVLLNPIREQLRNNKARSQSRVAVEWVFGDISKFFVFFLFQK